MKDMHDFNAGNRSAHGFNDELLLALERSGKTLVQIQSIILPWGNEKSEEMISVDGKQVISYSFKTLCPEMDSQVDSS
jgi:hypothetical protein